MKHNDMRSPSFESPEFRRSAAYDDYRAAMLAVGVHTYADLLRQPRATRDRFHAEWTARMQARCGIDPREVTPSGRLKTIPRLDTSARDAVTRAERERQVRELFAAGATDTAIADALGVTTASVSQLRAKYGLVRPKPETPAKAYRYEWYALAPDQRAARGEALRLRTENGLGFDAIAERLGINPATAWKWVRDERARTHPSHRAA